jgi:predicted dehydrogenase/dTDP-4-amino-4,6-dideoxygalactose transaminase
LLLPHGTDALRLGLAAALDHDGLDYGGEVIVPNLSFIASASAPLDRRLGVALVDVDAATLTLDPRRVQEAIIPGKTRAIMAVHLFGQPADMGALGQIARRHSLLLIEDAAQAHGAIHELGRAGSLGDAGAFSFQSAKNLPSGEGGALTTNDSMILERAYGLHNVGRALSGGTRWGHNSLGWNCRPTEYVAAVLLQRFKYLEAQQQVRWERFQRLLELLGETPCVEPLKLASWVRRHGVHMFVMRYRPEGCGGLDLADFLRAINAEGIPLARAYEKTLAQQPAMQELLQRRPNFLRALDTPVANEAVKDMIYLPHHLFLGSEADVQEIAAAFLKVQRHYAPAALPSRAAGAKPVSHLALPQMKTQATAAEVNTPARIIRIGIVGVGSMGMTHLGAITANARFHLAGVADPRAEVAQEVAERFKCNGFASLEELLARNHVEAVVLATPHWQHAEQAIACLRAGVHLLCEKPLAVTTEQADQILNAARDSKRLFAVVHQTRFEPAFQYVKALLASGELGPIYRCSMVESAWRTEAYYRSSPWRGTWKGEGGGVLLNQAPHLLDRYVWLCGLPQSVLGQCDTNGHRIEVEDTVSAVLRHANGAHGFIHLSTVECPAVSQTVICCDRGRIHLESGNLRITRLSNSIRERTATDTRMWGDLEHESRELRFSSGQGLLDAFYENVADAVIGKAKLVCPGDEGRNAVELANAIALSSAQQKAVSFPIDRAAYTTWLATKVSGR